MQPSASQAQRPDLGGRGTDGPRPRPHLALALLLSVSFMVVLDFSIVNVALASIERELHAAATDVQWVITAYAIAFGGLLILGGRLGDLFGRRRMLVVGLTVFSIASLAGGLATSIDGLIIARAVQGIGAAVVAPAALSLLTTTTSEGAARNRALGYYSATAAVGFVAGLVLGGLLVQLFDWRAVLWVNVPIGLAAAALAPTLLPPTAPITRQSRLDLPGALLATTAIAAFVYAVSQAPNTGWMSAQTLLAAALSGALALGFLLVEQHHQNPLLPLAILHRPSLRTANLVMLLTGAWVAGELLVIPLYLQLVLHYSPLLSGLAIAPQGVVGFVSSTQSATLARRVGLRPLMIAAPSAAGLGLLIVGLSLGSGNYAALITGLMLAGVGTATATFASTVAATQGLPNSKQGLAGGLINMSRQVGAAMGVAIAAAIIGTGAASGESIRADSLSLVVMAGAALTAALLVAQQRRVFAVTGLANRASTDTSQWPPGQHQHRSD